MEQEIEKVINFLKGMREHPLLYFGYQNDPAIARAYLNGMRSVALKLLGFDNSVGEIVNIEDAAARRRGYWYQEDGVIPALKNKGLDDNEIVTELVETEIEFWTIYGERLRS
jgi:hypothetical protein